MIQGKEKEAKPWLPIMVSELAISGCATMDELL